ncbi:MAG: DUF3459 domain-containing protein, partial [Chloroflexi bacterium]|nr:DUF3459 domain-containing protein [Chloroflexota bacterium]
IGMHDVPIPADQVQDPFEKNVPGIGVGRDPERTPMQWSPGTGAGFTTGVPWLPLAQDYRQVNVEVERQDTRSMLSLHRRLIELRRRTAALSMGAYSGVYGDEDVLVYERSAGDERVRVALNLSHAARSLAWAEPRAQVVVSTHLDRDGDVGESLDLRADEGVVIRLAL